MWPTWNMEGIILEVLKLHPSLPPSALLPTCMKAMVVRKFLSSNKTN
jgi:hypothetical protein